MYVRRNFPQFVCMTWGGVDTQEWVVMGSDGFGCVEWDGSAKGDTVKRVRRTHITTIDTIVYVDMEG